MNNRLKLIRENSEFPTMEQFGKRLGVTKAAISRLEKGERAITDQMINSVCETFNVNEKWLRTGEGDMYFQINVEKELAKLTVDFLKSEPESFRRRVITYLAKMSDEQWKMVEDMVNELATKKESKE